MPCEIRIGTSGWQYRHWLGTFYPPESRPSKLLETYATHFDTVEVNNTFYRLPAATVFERWRKASPQGFLFAVKGSRFLTHMRKLKDPEDSLRLLLKRAEALEGKLGPILFQLPPRWRCDLDRLDVFLDALPSGHRYALELRDKSWLNDKVYEAMRRRNVAFCIYDLAGSESPHEVTADFAYVRLHGPGERAYEGSYTEADLRRWATEIEGWQHTLNAVYVYFDNDQGGYAPRNALQLKSLVG
jgi:uncharacterized protein YecE (DUF72 family)